MKTTARIRKYLPAALLLVVMMIPAPAGAIEVRVSINLIDTAGLLHHPAGERQPSALAALMAEERRTAEAAAGYAASTAPVQPAVQRCYEQLPAGYRALHEARFVRQWGALGSDEVMTRMLGEWQRLNSLPCGETIHDRG